MKRLPLFCSAALMVLAAAFTPGCQSGAVLARVKNQLTTPEGGQVYVVATEKTSFYRYGPQQGNGPDSELQKDTLVKLIRNSFGYSKVQVASTGQQGFVASEDIMRASPTLLAALTKPPEVVASTNTSASSPASTVENIDVRSSDASFVPPPEALPPPDLPPPSAEPTPQ
ncbi:MAG: hypothetical protein ABR526_00440 [Chthoniobacterales bacterium]